MNAFSRSQLHTYKLSSRLSPPRRPSGGTCFFSTYYLRRWLHTQAVMSITVADRISLGGLGRVFKLISDARAPAQRDMHRLAYGTISIVSMHLKTQTTLTAPTAGPSESAPRPHWQTCLLYTSPSPRDGL